MLPQTCDLPLLGLLLCAGHTEASYAQINTAADNGLVGITHLYNAMSQVTPREPGTVGAALEDLTGQYPDLRQHLYDGQELRSFVNIYLNQEDIRFGDKNQYDSFFNGEEFMGYAGEFSLGRDAKHWNFWKSW